MLNADERRYGVSSEERSETVELSWSSRVMTALRFSAVVKPKSVPPVFRLQCGDGHVSSQLMALMARASVAGAGRNRATRLYSGVAYRLEAGG